MLIIQSQVELESCTLETAGGGQGGTGGKGGEGSSGGQGAPGGIGPKRAYPNATNPTHNFYGGRGGRGGNGGAGGTGGNGGNGGGGPSVGVWCSGISSSVSAQRTGFNLGDAGVQGGGPAAEGEPGIRTNSQACTTPL